MAQKQNAAKSIDEIIAKLQELKKTLGSAPAAAESEEAAAIELPSPKEISKMKDKDVIVLAEQLNIEVGEKDADDLKVTLKLASRFASEEKLDDDDLATLAEGLGLEVSKKAKTNHASITEYLSAGAAAEETEEDTTDEAAEEETTEEASEEETSEEETSEEETSEEAEEEEAPKSKKKKAKKEEEESEDEESEEPAADEAEETSEEESSEEETTEDAEVDGDDDAEAEGPTDGDLKAAIAVYNKVAKKPIKPKDIDAMRAKLTDDGEVVHPMGEAYTKDGGAWANGFPLVDVEGEDYAKCRVTGKFYAYDDEENLVEHVVKKKAKK